MTKVGRRVNLALQRLTRRLVEGERPLRISELMSPLRYDIVVRQQYMRFLSEHLDLYHSDFEEYTSVVMGQPYFVWFREIAYPRRQRSRIRPENLRLAFQTRLRKTTVLFQDFTRDGFDDRHPVLMRTGTHFVPTATGKELAPRYHPIDGCHRLALLHMDGHLDIPPTYYRVELARHFSSIDNTYVLLRFLDIDPAAYYSFLSLGYCNDVFDDRERLLDHLAAHRPELLPELKGVLAVDEPLLRRT